MTQVSGRVELIDLRQHAVFVRGMAGLGYFADDEVFSRILKNLKETDFCFEAVFKTEGAVITDFVPDCTFVAPRKKEKAGGTK
jgi:hypothetical protein